MVTIIIMALTLALLQIWIIPMTGALVINIKSMSYLLSNRDKEKPQLRFPQEFLGPLQTCKKACLHFSRSQSYQSLLRWITQCTR